MRKPEESGVDGGPDGSDASFLDSPEIIRCVFHPRRTRPTPEIPGRRHPFFFSVETDVNIDGVIHFAGESASKAPNAPNILFFHGNGETVADYDEIGPLYNEQGINFAVVDYRGYGTSSGSPSYSRHDDGRSLHIPPISGYSETMLPIGPGLRHGPKPRIVSSSGSCGPVPGPDFRPDP